MKLKFSTLIYYFLLLQLNLLFISAQLLPTDTFLFDINKLKIPIGNNGLIGSIGINNQSRAVFDSVNIFYSAGFYLTGFVKDSLSGNGNFNSAAIEHYVPGRTGSDINDPENKFYILKSNDSPFGESWQQWKDAVKQGADFYDGDKDGIYNPVDKNGNNTWDTDEDRPGLTGDLTAWCIFNDGQSREYKNGGFKDVKPMGINISQTMFGFNDPRHPRLNNVIFIRYVTENFGLTADKIDSVYFGVIFDTDIGNYNDDLAGCIPAKNSGYAYNDGPDELYGNNPPAFLVDILEGPFVYEPGKTFTDMNNNGLFDPADIPLDTAQYNYGPFIGKKKFPGASNINMRAFTVGSSADPFTGAPDNPKQMFNLLKGGRQLNGDSVYVSSWQFGNGNSLGSDTANIKSRYMYNGNPVLSEGWLNNFETDNKILLSVGPFTLEKNEPEELLIAYIVGRGDDNLSSITEVVETDSLVQNIYENNFTDIISGVNNNKNYLTKNYRLFQNYPNPFNPTTKIKFTIPNTAIPSLEGNERGGLEHVSLIVYDILGREVATLLDEHKSPGTYEVNFNAESLQSGVYFYRLQVGDKYEAVKKMMVLK